MIELDPRSLGNNGTNDTDGAHGVTVTTLHPQVDHTAQRVKDVTTEGVNRLISALSTALTQFDRRAEQLKNLHANVLEQASSSVCQYPVITIGLAFAVGTLLKQLTRD